MAYTHIHPITATVENSIGYIMADKKEDFLKDDIADSINYIMDDKTGEITYLTLSSTLNCTNPQNPIEDFHALMQTFGKDEIENGNAKTKDGAPILAWHLIQSFEGQEVSPLVANEIGRKLAEEIFGNHAVVISTHTNTDDIHNHIEFSAWDLNGRKWDQCNKNYQRIRECSDRLCDEYGLSVIEHTRQQKLIKWEDSEGKTRYFEPTDRKIEMIRKREAGELSTDDVNSYRNTIPYEAAVAKKQTNIEMVKQAIDSKLPYATSYDHLLAMLREMGYQIKDKKKNGQWREHITFQPPTADKGVRDYKISEDGYYTRESLTALIEEQNAERSRNESLQSKLNLPFYETYEYGEIDVQAINEDYRADRTAGGGFKVVQRGEAEKSIIRDVKKSDMELYGLYDTTYIHRLIAEQKAAQKYKKPAKKREEVLVSQIQESFANLRFIEQKQLYSYNQINEVVKGLWDQYNACLAKISEAEGMVAKLESIAAAPYTLKEVRDRIEQGKNNPAYMLEKYPADVKLLKSCMEDIKKHNVTDAESLKKLQDSIQKYRGQITTLQASLASFSAELSNYNRCVATLARIDRDSGRDNSELLENYQAIVRSGQAQAEQQERQAQEKEKKKQKGLDR